MPVKDLRMAGSEKAAKKVIMTEVVETVVTETVEVVIGVAQDIHNAAVADRNTLIAELGTTPGDIPAAVTKIRAMTAHINDISAAIVAARFNADAPEARVAAINSLVSNLRDANSDLFFQGERIADALVKADNIDGYDDDELFVNQSRGDDYNNVLPAAESTPADGISVFASNLAIRDANGDVIGSIGTDATFLHTVDYDTLEQIVTDAFNEGYNSAWNDGYEAGYADGYRDGFRDGVDSVR